MKLKLEGNLEWIKKSEVYRNKGTVDFSKQKIPLFKLQKVENIQEFQLLLACIDFWKIDKPYPIEFYDYIFNNEEQIEEKMKI